MSDFETIAIFMDHTEAMVVRSVLEDAGIAAFIPNEHQHFNISFMTPANEGIRLQVLAEDAWRARQVLAQAQTPDANDLPEPNEKPDSKDQ